MKNDSNESSKGPVDATGEWMKEVTDQLRSESEGEVRKQETSEQASRGESKDEVKEGPELKESLDGGEGEGEAKERTREEEGEDVLEEQEERERAIVERFWVNQGSINPGGFTFKPNSRVHSSILILPLVPQAYQIVTGNANDAPSEKDASKNIFLVKANAMNPPILHPPPPPPPSPASLEHRQQPELIQVKPSTASASVHQNHHLHNRMSDPFMNQLVSSPAAVPFDSAIRFTTAHSNSPMVPLLLLDSPEAGATLLRHPQAQLKQLQFGHHNLQLGSFAPVNLPTRWWLSHPQLTPADTSSVKSDREQEKDPKGTGKGEGEEEKSAELPVSTEETNAASTETTSDSTEERARDASDAAASQAPASSQATDAASVQDAVTTPASASEEATSLAPEKKDEGQVDGDKSESSGEGTSSSGSRKRRQLEGASATDSTVARGETGGEKSASTIDDVVKSIVASNSKNNAQASQEKQASAPSTPLEGILKNGQAKNPLEMGLEIASGILTSIRTATSDAGLGLGGKGAAGGGGGGGGDGGLFASPTRNREMSLSSLLAKSPIGSGSDEKITNNNNPNSSSNIKSNSKDSGLFHVFRGVFGSF